MSRSEPVLIFAHVAAVEIDEAAQARSANRRSPGDRAGRGPQRRSRNAAAGELEEIRRSAAYRRRRPDCRDTWCRPSSRPPLMARSGIGRVNASSSKPWLRTPPREIARACAGAGISVGVGTVQIVATAVDGLNNEVEAVERIELEVPENLVKNREVHVDSAPMIFKRRASNASLISGLNCKSAPEATMPWQPV